MRVLLLAALLFGVGLAGLETLWRGRGHAPSVVDDFDLWSQERARAQGAAPIALLGASRMLLDVSLDTLAARLPERPAVQLAVGGAYPLATLRNLAEDEAFAGLAVVGLNAEALEPSRWEDQQPYVDYFEGRWRLERRVDRRLTTALEARLASVNPRVGLVGVGREWLRAGQLPEPFHIVTRPDRGKLADYSGVDFSRNRALGDRLVRAHYRDAEISPPDEWLASAREIEPWVARITGRGGRVAFVRFPTAGIHWQQEERHYPRRRYWDRFAAETSALTLHFRDLPGAAELPIPDGSHLDQRHAPRFTELLLDALQPANAF